MPNELCAATFSTYLNTSFNIQFAPGNELAVELVEVTEKGGTDSLAASAAHRQERFSVVFRGPRPMRLEQGMYQLQHTHLGAVELFLVPVGQDHTWLYYEAVFNRLRGPDA